MSLAPRTPATLRPMQFAALDKLRRVGADRAHGQVLEVEGRKALLSVSTVMVLKVHHVTMHDVLPNDSIGQSSSMAVVEAQERPAPYGMHDAPDPLGLVLPTLMRGTAFESAGHRARVDPVWYVGPLQWPPESLQLTGPLAQYLNDQADAAPMEGAAP